MMDHLDEDIAHQNGLKYAAISFAASKTRQRLDAEGKVALRVRGGFATTDDAMAHVKRLDRTLDTYVCDMYRWICVGNVTPDMDTEAHLTDMVKARRKRNEIEKQRFEERKKHAMENSIDDVPDHLDDLKNASLDKKEEETDPSHDLKRLKVINEEEDKEEITAVGGVSMSDSDSITVGDLKFVALSYVEPDAEYQEMTTPEGVMGIKIRGIFATKEEAESHIQEVLTKLDPDFDIFVCDLYRFLLLPCKHEDIETVYREEYLQGMFSDYKKSQTAAQTFMKSADTQGLERVVHPTELKAIEGQ